VTDPTPELSIVMPCLNEAETLATCIEKAKRFLASHHVDGEIIVADNGSSDGSQAIAARLGVRVVDVPERGYGSALHGGISAARGRYVVIGDADDSYDFSELGAFLERLRAGDALVMGNRFRGRILPGAMPPLHRFLGNPVLSAIGRLFFRSPVGDFHCGLRAVNRAAYDAMAPTTTGMEYASELVIKATLAGLPISEVPITLHPDGRSRPPHLRSWRDGWRHLRFMLLFSPRWLFLAPGSVLFGLGFSASLWLLSGERQVGPAQLGIHSLLVAGLACLLGYQLIVFALFTEVFAITEGFQPMPAALDRLFAHVTLELGIAVGLVLALAGLATLVAATLHWNAAGFGTLDPTLTMRVVIPGAVLLVLGIQTIFSSFFLSVLGIRRRRPGATP
jgi:glycosyltransferase involved in cell wall biosynthesis